MSAIHVQMHDMLCTIRPQQLLTMSVPKPSVSAAKVAQIFDEAPVGYVRGGMALGQRDRTLLLSFGLGASNKAPRTARAGFWGYWRSRRHGHATHGFVGVCPRGLYSWGYICGWTYTVVVSSDVSFDCCYSGKQSREEVLVEPSPLGKSVLVMRKDYSQTLRAHTSSSRARAGRALSRWSHSLTVPVTISEDCDPRYSHTTPLNCCCRAAHFPGCAFPDMWSSTNFCAWYKSSIFD